MAKERISVTVDEDVYEYLSREHINTSGLVNKCMKSFMNGGGDTDVLADFRVQQLLDEAEDLQQRSKRKREKAQKLRAEREKKDTERTNEQRQQLLEEAANIPADPTHAFVVEHADTLNMTPEEFAQLIADEHGKTYDPYGR